MSRKANWKKATDALGSQIVETVKSASTKQLRAFLRSLREVPPTQTNCWWLSFHLAPTLAMQVRNELICRRKKNVA